MMRLPFLAVISVALALTFAGPAAAGQVRQYYIAADEIDWDYMPGGADNMMGMAPMGYAKFYGTRDKHLIGHVYRKAVYHEYTDATFSHLKPRPDGDAYLGTMGPILHAEVGDTIRILFKNNGTHPYSMHPHGVLYEKPSEGAPYNDGIALAQKGGDSVAPGKTFEYVWQVPERAGPGPNDPSSVFWLYHSHAEERKDVNAGLIGGLVITRAGMARPDGTPKDVDREVVQLYMVYDESRSWFLDENMNRFMGDPKHTDISKNSPLDIDGHYDPLGGTGPGTQNFRFTINGYSYADGPTVEMKRGSHVRWYVATIGEAFNFHTPHWHGNTVLVAGQRTDVLNIAPAQMITADMWPDAPGTWIMHCHVSDHMEQGMAAFYRVLP